MSVRVSPKKIKILAASLKGMLGIWGLPFLILHQSYKANVVQLQASTIRPWNFFFFFGKLWINRFYIRCVQILVYTVEKHLHPYPAHLHDFTAGMFGIFIQMSIKLKTHV